MAKDLEQLSIANETYNVKDKNAVHKSGNERIEGTKTFASAVPLEVSGGVQSGNNNAVNGNAVYNAISKNNSDNIVPAIVQTVNTAIGDNNSALEKVYGNGLIYDPVSRGLSLTTPSGSAVSTVAIADSFVEENTFRFTKSQIVIPLVFDTGTTGKRLLSLQVEGGHWEKLPTGAYVKYPVACVLSGLNSTAGYIVQGSCEFTIRKQNVGTSHDIMGCNGISGPSWSYPQFYSSDVFYNGENNVVDVVTQARTIMQVIQQSTGICCRLYAEWTSLFMANVLGSDGYVMGTYRLERLR